MLDLRRAAAYMSLRQYAEALGDCGRARALDPTYAKAFSRLATLFTEVSAFVDMCIVSMCHCTSLATFPIASHHALEVLPPRVNHCTRPHLGYITSACLLTHCVGKRVQHHGTFCF